MNLLNKISLPIKWITVLGILKYVNEFISDLLLSYLFLIGILKFDVNNRMLPWLIGISIFVWLLRFAKFKKLPLEYWKVNKVSQSILLIVSLYGFLIGFISNTERAITFMTLLIINNLIGKIFDSLYYQEYSANKKRKTLVHELGHFCLCVGYDILNPTQISLVQTGDRSGYIVTDVNDESIDVFKYIAMCIAGYVAEQFFLEDRKEFVSRELRNILLPELESQKYSNEYLSSIIAIYLDELKLKSIADDVVAILELHRDNILEIEKENRYKEQFELKQYIPLLLGQ